MTEGERDSSGGELTSFLHLTGKRPILLILIAGLAGMLGVVLALGDPATFQARYVLNVDRVADNDLAIGEVAIVAEEIVSTASFPEVQVAVEEQTGLVFEDDYEIAINRAGGALININVVAEQPDDAQNVAIETGIAAVAITTERQAAGIESSRDQLEREVADVRAEMAALTSQAGGINPIVALNNAEAALLQRRADELNPPTRPILRQDGTIEQVPVPYTGPSADELQIIVDTLSPIERDFTSLQTSEAALTVSLSNRNNSLRELDSAIRLIESERETSLVISEVVTEETSRITGLLTGLLLFAVPVALLIIVAFTVYDLVTKKPEDDVESTEEEPFDPVGELREQSPRALPESSVHRSLTVVDNDILNDDDGFSIDNDGVIDVVAVDTDDRNDEGEQDVSEGDDAEAAAADTAEEAAEETAEETDDEDAVELAADASDHDTDDSSDADDDHSDEANTKPTSAKARAQAKASKRSKANNASNSKKNSQTKPKLNGSSKRVRDKDGRWGSAQNSKAG